jgi:hypothetical protein
MVQKVVSDIEGEMRERVLKNGSTKDLGRKGVGGIG